MPYSDQTIEDIKNRIILSDLLSSYTTVVSKNKEKWCCCPFHNEKTPSMIIHDDTGFFHCFGCGKSGTVFTVIQEKENLTFPEAVELLARKAGVELVQLTDKEKENHKKRDALLDLLDKITNTFTYLLLNTPEGQKARDYLSKRKISEETVKKFRLGYSLADPYWLYKFLKNKGYSDEILSVSGLFAKNNIKYTLFADRLIFPIRNKEGRVIAFSGRDLSGTSDRKYANSTDSDVYKKKNELLGLYESLASFKEMGNESRVVLCEGNFDVISLHQSGVDYAVASCGTSFTEEQCRLLQRYVKKIDLLMDTDEAGIKATKKSLLIAQSLGLENYVIKPFSLAKDSSELLEKEGPQVLKNCCSDTLPGFNYLVQSSINMYDINLPQGKRNICKEVRPYIDATVSPIERQEYIKLLSQTIRVPEKDIVAEYGSLGNTQKKYSADKDESAKPLKNAYDPYRLPEDLHIMLVLLNNKEYFPQFRSQIRINQLNDGAAVKLYEVLENAIRNNVCSDTVLLEMIEDEELKNLALMSFNEPDLFKPENTEKTLSASVKQLKLNDLLEKQKILNSSLNALQLTGASIEEITNVVSEIQNLNQEIERIRSSLSH